MGKVFIILSLVANKAETKHGSGGVRVAPQYLRPCALDDYSFMFPDNDWQSYLPDVRY